MSVPKEKIAFELQFDEDHLDRVQKALDEAQYRYSNFASVMDLLAEGFGDGNFSGQDGRVAALCELVACGARWIAETEGEEIGGVATQIRMIKKTQNYCFVNPEIEVAS